MKSRTSPSWVCQFRVRRKGIARVAHARRVRACASLPGNARPGGPPAWRGTVRSHCGRVNEHAKPPRRGRHNRSRRRRDLHSRRRSTAWKQGRRPSRATRGEDSPPTAQTRSGGAAAQLADRRSFMGVLPTLGIPRQRQHQQRQAPPEEVPARCVCGRPRQPALRECPSIKPPEPDEVNQNLVTNRPRALQPVEPGAINVARVRPSPRPSTPIVCKNPATTLRPLGR